MAANRSSERLQHGQISVSRPESSRRLGRRIVAGISSSTRKVTLPKGAEDRRSHIHTYIHQGEPSERTGSSPHSPNSRCQTHYHHLARLTDAPISMRRQWKNTRPRIRSMSIPFTRGAGDVSAHGCIEQASRCCGWPMPCCTWGCAPCC